MDLAALICTVRRPSCRACPLLDVCRYATDPALPTPRRVAESRMPYHTSTRFLRGRLVDALRGLNPGEQLSLPAASTLLGAAGRSDLEAVTLLRGLVRDGLAVEHAGPAFSLP